MTLASDIKALPTVVGDGNTGHHNNHQVIHAALKDQVGKVEDAVLKSSQASNEANSAIDRVTALEALGGLSPESPVDGQTANLVTQQGTLTRGAVSDVISSETAAVSAARFGAKGDGATDDTQAIQDAVDWVHAQGGGTVLVPDGVYMILAHVPGGKPGLGNLLDEGGIAMRDNVHLRLSGGAVLQAITNPERNYIIVRCYDVNNVLISGGTIRGDRYTHTGTIGEWGHGISITGGTNIVIEDILIEDCWGDGIYTQEMPAPSPVPEGYVGVVPQGVYLTRVVCSNNRRQGMSVVGVIDLVATDCVFKDTHGTSPEAGVDIEPLVMRRPTEKMRFIRCKFLNNAGNGIVAVNNITKDLEVVDCEFDGNQSIEAQVKTSVASRGFRFIGNTITNTRSGARSIFLRGGGDYEVVNNQADANMGVSSRDGQIVENIIISGNSFISRLDVHMGTSIFVFGGDNVLISNNDLEVLSDNSNGIRVAGGENIIIENNTVSGGNISLLVGAYEGSGVSKRARIRGNTLIDPTIGGANFSGIEGVTFTDNYLYGVGHGNVSAAFVAFMGPTSGGSVVGNEFHQSPMHATGEGRASMGVRILEHGTDTHVSGNRIYRETGKTMSLWDPSKAKMTTGYIGNEQGLMVSPTSALPSDPEIGTQVWDTTLSRMVIWDGEVWVDIVAAHPDPDPADI